MLLHCLSVCLRRVPRAATDVSQFSAAFRWHCQLYAPEEHNGVNDGDDISLDSHQGVLAEDAGYLPFEG